MFGILLNSEDLFCILPDIKFFFVFCWILRISFAFCWKLQIFVCILPEIIDFFCLLLESTDLFCPLLKIAKIFFAFCRKLRIFCILLKIRDIIFAFCRNHRYLFHFAGNYGSLLHFLHFAGVGGSVKWMAEDLSSVYRCHPSMEGSTKTLGNAMWSFTAREILIW